MELRCFICKCKIDLAKEFAFVFECYVYCDKCVKEIEQKDEGRVWRKAKKECQVLDVQS